MFSATLLSLSLLSAQPEYKPLPVPAQAIAQAAAHAAGLPSIEIQGVKVVPDAPYLHYLWFRETDPALLKEDMQAALLILNMTSQLGADPYGWGSPVRPLQVGERLMMVDLRYLAESVEGLGKLIQTWEEYRYDPSFSTLLTKGTLVLLAPEHKIKRKHKRLEKTNWRIVDENRQFDQGGKKVWGRWVWDEKWVEELVEVGVGDLSDADVIRFNPEHVDPEPLLFLQRTLRTEAPVIEAEYWAYRAMRSIKGKGSYRTIYGGLYPDLTGLSRLKKEKGQTDEDALLRRLGIVNPDSTKTALQVFDELRSDRRSAMFNSKVSDGPRRIDTFPTLSASPEDVSVLFVTNDISNRDIEIGQHPVHNLKNAKFKAREWIWRGTNGLDRYELSSVETGEFQEVVPPDVANDNTIPSGWGGQKHPELQHPEGCMACHGPHEGYQPAPNEVQTMFRARASIFGQIRGPKAAAIFDDLLRLEQQYRGDTTEIFRMARTANARAVLRVTGPWVKSKTQADIVKIAYAKAVELPRRYAYVLVNSKLSLRDLGFELPKQKTTAEDKAKEIEFLQKLLPPVGQGQDNDLVPEDARLWGLLSGLEIGRIRDWAPFYSFAAARSQKTLGEWRQLKKAG